LMIVMLCWTMRINFDCFSMKTKFLSEHLHQTFHCYIMKFLQLYDKDLIMLYNKVLVILQISHCNTV
jgi:hypothetical protein